MLPCPEDAFVRFPAGLNTPGGTLVIVLLPVPVVFPILAPERVGALVVPGGTLIMLPGDNEPVLFPGGSTLVGGGGEGGVAGEDPTTDGGTIEFAPSSHLSQEARSPLEVY